MENNTHIENKSEVQQSVQSDAQPENNPDNQDPTTIEEVKPVVPLDITPTLDKVQYNRKYELHRASIGQIMVSFKLIATNPFHPKNTYQQVFGDLTSAAATKLVEAYEKILVCENDKEKNVKFFNLIVNLPKNITIDEEHHANMHLGSSSIGSLLDALKQRIDFIVKREVPDKCKADDDLQKYFIQMQREIDEFYDDVDDFEAEFVTIVDKAHKAQELEDRQRNNYGNNNRNYNHANRNNNHANRNVNNGPQKPLNK